MSGIAKNIVLSLGLAILVCGCGNEKRNERKIAKAAAELKVHGYKANEEDFLIATVIEDNPIVIKHFINAGLSPDTPDSTGETVLLKAIKNGFHGTAVTLIKNGAELNYIHPKTGNTPLITAVHHHQIRIVAKLTEYRKLSMEHKNNSGENALLKAARQGSFKIARRLIIEGADPNATDNDENTVLLHALKKSNPQFALFLLDNCPVNLDHQNSSGQSALLLAAMHQYSDISDVIIARKSNLNLPDDQGNTAVIYAVINRNKQLLKQLADAGADLNQSNNKGHTPLHYAITKNFEEITEYILFREAKVNTKDTTGRTPLMIAAQKGFYNLCKLILSEKGEADAQDMSGKTALMYAIENNNPGIVRLLLKHKAKVNLRDMKGNTALMYAVKADMKPAISLLLEYDAEVNVKNNDDRTPLNEARSEKVKTLLEEAGGKKGRKTLLEKLRSIF